MYFLSEANALGILSQMEWAYIAPSPLPEETNRREVVPSIPLLGLCFNALPQLSQV